MLLIAGGLLILLLLLWLGTRMIPRQRPAPFTPAAVDQREVEVGGETVDLAELERASREADAMARQLELELGGLQGEAAESR